jgi:hypothetical protein
LARGRRGKVSPQRWRAVARSVPAKGGHRVPTIFVRRFRCPQFCGHQRIQGYLRGTYPWRGADADNHFRARPLPRPSSSGVPTRSMTQARSAALESAPSHSGYPVEDAVAYPEPEEVTETQGRFFKPTPFSPERSVAQEHQDIRHGAQVDFEKIVKESRSATGRRHDRQSLGTPRSPAQVSIPLVRV